MLFHFLLGVKMAPRETESNAYAKFWGNKQRALWYVMVFSGVVNCLLITRSNLQASGTFYNAAVTLAVIFQKLELVKSHIEAQMHNHTIRCGG